MKALLPSLGLKPIDGQSLPIKNYNMDGRPLVKNGSGKVGVDSKVGGVGNGKFGEDGEIMGQGNGKLGEDGKVVGEGNGRMGVDGKVVGGKESSFLLDAMTKIIRIVEEVRADFNHNSL
jgi:hypothetical protein